MGGRLVALAREAPDLRVAGAFERAGHPAIGRDAGEMAGVGTLGIAVALGRRLDDVGVYGRHGLVGERGATEIGIHALRGGDIAGEHTVVFSTLGERLELTHRAHSRDTFAHGALRAARWVRTAAPG